MPSTQRSPPPPKPASHQAQDAAHGQRAPEDHGVQDINFHGDVVKLVAAKPPTDPEPIFRNKNAHVKRTITRATNILTPLETGSIRHLHDNDITMLRDHLNKIEKAINSLNDFIDIEAHNLPEDTLHTYVHEADAHVPRIIDLRARVNELERLLQAYTNPPQPPPSIPERKTVNKIDNTFRPKPLEKSATPARFNKWKREFKIYVRRNGFQNAPIDEQRVLLNNSLSPEMEDALERLCLPEDDDSLDRVIDCIEKHLEQSNNLVIQRFAYFNCVQKAGESIEQYIIRFRTLGDYADFDNFSYDDNMIYRLLTGIRDSQLRKELLKLPKGKFAKFKEHALAWEVSQFNSDLTEPQARSSHSTLEDNISVEKVSAYKANRRSAFGSVSSQKSSGNDNPNNSEGAQGKQANDRQGCYHCGLQRHPGSECPAKNKTCNYCNKLGHFSKVCRKARNDRKNRGQPRGVQVVKESDDQPSSPSEAQLNVGNLDFHVWEVDNRSQAPTPKISVAISSADGKLGEQDVVPDTGAAVSVLPARLARSWGLPPSPLSSQRSLTSADGSPIACLGTLQLTVTHGNLSSMVVFYVCDGVRNVLLSWMALKNIAVISPNFPRQLDTYDGIAHIQTKVLTDHIKALKSKYVLQYPTVFGNVSLSTMRGPPMHIYLKPDFKPELIKPITRPRPVPVPLRDAVHAELMSWVKQDIIRPIHEPTDFVSPMVVVPKKSNDRVRLVIDYTQLNKFVKRPSHPFPSMAEVRALIPPTSGYFATLDAVQGYLQIPLHPEAQPLTTFITPWGRFCFKRAPMGLSCSGDVFCARGDQAFQGINNIIKVVDDILLFADDLKTLQDTITSVLEAAKLRNISLSSEKFHIGTVVDFVGFTISKDSIRPDERHFEALAKFPRPANRTDLRSFLGLTNQFSAFSPNIASIAKTLRPLLSKAARWSWEKCHQDAFDSLRQELIQSSSLHCFNSARKTRLLTNASRLNGLGYALMQHLEETNTWALISCGSRFINDTEANYAVFELEALAIVWAIQKCRLFLLGLPSFEVVTDHRPLVSIFNSTRLAKSDNPRILRLMHKVAMYTFEVVWTPGRTHNIPDALSRAPVQRHDAHLVAELHDDVSIFATEDSAIVSMARAASTDSSYQDIVHAIQGMSLHDVKKLPLSTHQHVRILASSWNRLSIDSATRLVLLDASRILVPKTKRAFVVKQVHLAHQGITRTKARMQALYFWPGMANQIIQAVQSCDMCLKYRDNQPAQPLTEHPIPPRPFHSVSIDIFEFHRTFFMTYVDRFSGWPSVVNFQKSPSSIQIISALLSIFKDFGVPNTIRHDGATPLVSEEFKEFLAEHHIQDQLTSAYNPTSNGHAEASVKSMKLLIKKNWLTSSLDKQKFATALLEWRNIPKYPGGLSPAEMVFGRKLRTGAPCISYKCISQSDVLSAVKSNHAYMQKSYQNVNISRKRILPPLSQGDQVRIRNCQTNTWDKSGVVLRPRNNGKSYVVQVRGRKLLRNRRLLLKITPSID